MSRREPAARSGAAQGAAMSPATPADLFAFLEKLGIAAETAEHAPVFTVAESRAIKAALPGGHSKNLFLRDKKGRLFLVVARDETAIDLKRLHEAIGAAGRLSFGSAELLRSLASPRLWQGWLEMAGIPGLVPDCGPTYSDSVLTCRAAAAGQGVALAPRSLVESDPAVANTVIDRVAKATGVSNLDVIAKMQQRRLR